MRSDRLGLGPPRDVHILALMAIRGAHIAPSELVVIGAFWDLGRFGTWPDALGSGNQSGRESCTPECGSRIDPEMGPFETRRWIGLARLMQAIGA
jgi:hypothetical protein